jgi:RpiB/LacA/LacB family sugar-phosphate isomerase
MSGPPAVHERMLPSEDEVRTMVAAVLAAVVSDERLDSAGGETSATGSGDDRSPSSSASGDVVVGADHGGYRLKERIVADLRDQGFDVTDCGTDSAESVDYPDFAHTVARLVAEGGCRWGIVVDGAGIGSCMVANKVPGIRAATCWDVSSARNSREHNHANVLVLGAGLIGENLALQIVHEWLSTPWGGDRHARRVDKITEIEQRYLAPGVEATR